MKNNDAEYARLSAESRKHLQAGYLDWYSFDLKAMANLLDREGKYVDEVKLLMVAFYIDLSGDRVRSYIDNDLAFSIRKAVLKSGMSDAEIEELYRDAVRSDITSRHCLTINDTLHLLKMTILGETGEASRILANAVD